jgi:hypothetical protein
MDKEEFVLALIDKVNEEKNKINTLTSEIFELENDLNPKNITKIKQNVSKIINAMSSFSSSYARLGYCEFIARMILTDIGERINDKNSIVSPTYWNEHIIFWLEKLCIAANTWNPIKFDFSKKGLKIEFKNLNFSIFNINE